MASTGDPQSSEIWSDWTVEEHDLPKSDFKHQPLRRVRLLKTRSQNHRKNLVVVLHGLDFTYPLPGEKVDCDHLNSFIKLLLLSEEKTETTALKKKTEITALANILLIDYHNHLFVHSQAAKNLPAAVSAAITQAHSQAVYENIILLGHSFGSLLARRVMVDAAEQMTRDSEGNTTQGSTGQATPHWCEHATGLISLAGTNLGFKLDKVNSIKLKIFSCIAGVTELVVPGLVNLLSSRGPIGRLASYSWRNSPWVVDTRLKWLRLYEGTNKFRKATDGQSIPIKTLSLTGTLDALVGQDDQEMVYQLGDLCCTKSIDDVRHEGFLDQAISTTSDTTSSQTSNATGGRTSPAVAQLNKQERLDLQSDIKFMLNLATNQPSSWKRIQRVSRLHSDQSMDEGSERTVVFLIHGIRDTAEWQEDIDYNLRQVHNSYMQAKQQSQTTSKNELPAQQANANILISQVRYGYFSALQFLFPSERRRAIRSFSDEYLRTIARFPDLKQENIHVYAHSNGTFVFGEALRKYSEIKVNRVLLGGSVLPPRFPWKKYVNSAPMPKSTENLNAAEQHQEDPNTPDGHQVMEILNYAANNDLPTGLLCRALGLIRLPLPNQPPLLGIGPGGTDGFKDLCNYNKPGRAGQVRGWNFFLKGDHGATLATGYQSAKGIATYLLGAKQITDSGSPEAYTYRELNESHNPNHPLKRKKQPRCTQSYPSKYRNITGTLLAALALVVALGIFTILIIFPFLGLTTSPLVLTIAGQHKIILNVILMMLVLYILGRL